MLVCVSPDLGSVEPLKKSSDFEPVENLLGSELIQFFPISDSWVTSV
jgi:hypothetical protein